MNRFIIWPALVLLAACSSTASKAEKAAYGKCRADCSSAHSTCFNNCNSLTTAAKRDACQTDCGRVQLPCQKDCEGRYPQDSDSMCRGDCSRQHSQCFNGCNSTSAPATCQTGCGNEQLVCQKDCQSRYP